MKRTNSAFTIVEIIVIVAVIGILAAVATVGIAIYQSDARDAQRSANATVLTEALEKYYTENGEYPSVPSISNTQSGNTPKTVADKLGVNEDAVTMPLSNQPLAITPPNQEASAPDAIVYNGESVVNSSNCQDATNGGCDKYTLTYTKDNGEEVTITSRYDGTTTANISTAPAKPSISVGSGGGLIVTANLSDPNCSDNATRLVAKYAFQYRVNGGAWSALSAWQTSDAYSLTGVQGSEYELRGHTRCDDATAGSTAEGLISPVSDPDAHVLPLNAPSAPSTSVALSGSNVVATASVVTCPAGATTQYAIRGRTNNGTWGAYSAWSTTRTASQAAAQGVRYGYQSQARCQNPETVSGAASGTEGAYVHPFSTPGAPGVSHSTSGATTNFSIGNVSCPAGGTARYQYRFVADWNYTSQWYGPYATKPAPSWNTANQGYSYKTEVQAHCYNTNHTSGWSGVGSSTYIRPVDGPGGTSWNGWRGDAATIYLSANTSCGSGAYPDTRADVHSWDWTWTPYPPYKYGWYRDHNGGRWVLNDLISRGNGVTTGSRSGIGNIPNGSGWNMSIDIRCRNQQTGRASGVQYRESQRFNL